MATLSPADTELIVRVLVDVKLVGALIGKKGATIKQLRAESGVQIDVSMQDAGITTPRTVMVQGKNLSPSEASYSPQTPPLQPPQTIIANIIKATTISTTTQMSQQPLPA
jgi:predicted PilT family ATPase